MQVERDADLAALARLELVAVQLHGVRVREDEVVADAGGHMRSSETLTGPSLGRE